MTYSRYVSLCSLFSLAGPLLIALFSSAAHADFISDSKARVELRNFYLNRDFRQSDAPQSKAAEWAQGFTGRLDSGYTDGTLGFGLDALGKVALKLDSSADRRGTGLLAFGPNSHEPADEFSELGLTAKLRLSKTVLKLGTLQPLLPVVTYNDTRLLATTYRGGLLNSEEVKGLSINAGRLTKVNLRDSSNEDDIGYGTVTSDAFDVAGASYSVTPDLKFSYYYGKLEDIYRQHFIGMTHNLSLGNNFYLRSDLRYFDSSGDGAQRAGQIDNKNFNGMISLSHGAHKVSAAYQTLSGDSAFPFLNGGDPYVVNLATFNTFARTEEDSWQLRYDYDFAALGVPGLTFMTRYVDGRNVQTASRDDGREWERDTDIAYVIQDGTFKNLSLRWRNVTFRTGNGLTTALDENRLIIGYTLAFW